MADSIRIFPDYYHAQFKNSRECLIARLTRIAFAIAAIQTLVLAYTLFTPDSEPIENPSVNSNPAPYIPPKPSFPQEPRS